MHYKTCLYCEYVTGQWEGECPECGCIHAVEDFNDPTGEQQDNALRNWADFIGGLDGVQ